VADHRFGDVHRNMLAAVVHRKRVADHLRRDGRAARPRLDHALVAGFVHPFDLHPQVLVDERAFLQAARHGALPPSAAGTPAANDQLVGRLLLLAGAAFGLAPRRDRVTTTRALAFAAAERVVDRVHRDTTGVGTLALPAVTTGLADRNQPG